MPWVVGVEDEEAPLPNTDESVRDEDDARQPPLGHEPEVALRSLLHRSGLRFRRDYAIRRSDGKAVHCDIAFTRRKIAVFVDGCFWHCCPEHGTVPKSNVAYWIPKLKQNVDRDRATDRGLQEAGWQVLRFWEHVSSEEAKAEVLRSLAEV